MKQLHKNFWNMVKDTVAYFYNDVSEWNNIQILKTNVEKLKDLEIKITAADKTQHEKNPEGKTTQKDSQFTKMTKVGYKLSCKVTSYALEVNDEALLPLVNFSITQLEEGTENDVVTRCQVIADKTQVLLPELADYKVTIADIKAFQEEIDQFKKMPPERDLVVNERKGAVNNIPEIITETRAILEKLDNNVEGFIDNDTFIYEYHQIRMINNRRGSQIKEKTDLDKAK